MIFKDIFENKQKIFSPEIDRLLDYAWQKQSHPGNLLLFHINGFYNEETLEWNNWHEQKFNPHVIGPGMEGHSEVLHHNFIHKYRTTHIANLTYVEYLKELTWSEKKHNQIREMIDFEETTIQLEMLIYLKFWEADMIIKKLYEFVRILQGKPYDWYFKVANSARDINSTGSRQDIIRLKIRNPLETISPLLYNLIKETYSTQLRNAIAHSNYSFMNRGISFHNYIEGDPASQAKGVSFDKWVDIFHNTLILHNEYIRMGNVINFHYGKIAMDNQTVIPILVTQQDCKQYEQFLEYRETYEDWHYKQ